MLEFQFCNFGVKILQKTEMLKMNIFYNNGSLFTLLGENVFLKNDKYVGNLHIGS